MDNTMYDYEYRVLCALRRIIRSVDIYSKKLNTKLGLTTPQLLCLHALAKSESMILTDLAREVNLGVSTVNGIIDRLEIKQFLTRSRSVKDRRKVSLEITSSGKNIISKAPSLLQDKLAASLSELSDEEQLVLTESLERVVTLMEVEKIDASPNLFPREQVTVNN
ncbi:MAG: MarR family transcriptional regulator [Desulfobulbaceae bacterium]|uniref:MarR family transcriptional regulator n=1 Tax=Candidatus Desulfatifera sulfidica TaxID=2841691 RepID=A0A8J6NAE5_9BACT|nr:MarR family transcriptional regulator [Candidatus Desulfatifera sulfidica]